jgi:hypothetical protein
MQVHSTTMNQQKCNGRIIMKNPLLSFMLMMRPLENTLLNQNHLHIKNTHTGMNLKKLIKHMFLKKSAGLNIMKNLQSLFTITTNPPPPSMKLNKRISHHSHNTSSWTTNLKHSTTTNQLQYHGLITMKSPPKNCIIWMNPLKSTIT